MIPDILGALLLYLRAQPEITALTNTRIYGIELPASEAQHMPRACLVVRFAGGVGPPYGVALMTPRVDVWHYGSSPSQAQELWRRVYTALNAMSREVQNGTLLHAAQESMGPMSTREPDTDWPVVLESWQILASTVAVA